MKIPIVCNGNRGYYLVHSSTCICCCVACMERAKRADLPCIQISPTEFERHSGTAASPAGHHRITPKTKFRQISSLSVMCVKEASRSLTVAPAPGPYVESCANRVHGGVTGSIQA